MKYLITHFSLFILISFSFQIHAQEFSPLSSKGELPKSIYDYSLGNNTSETSKDFVLEYEFALRTIFRSGNVIFGDSLSNYVRKCADYIYEKNENITVATEFFVLKSTTPNAFAFPNGYIFVTTGLLGQVENEAQLCFILAHEIAHVQEKHGWESYSDRTDILKGKGDYSGLSLEQRLNFALRKSKTHELDADKEGFIIYQKLGYDNRQVLRAFDMLLYSYLPFDEIEFDYNFLSDSFYRFPESFTSYVINDIDVNEDEDDDELTHPNVKNRKLAIAKIAKDSGTNKSFIINESYFKRVQQLARYENLYLNIQQGKLDKALYNIFLIEKHYGKSLYTAKCKAYALVNYAIAKSNGNLNPSEFRMGAKEVQGNTQAVTNLMRKLKSKDALVAAKRALLEGKRSYNHPVFTQLNESLNKSSQTKWNSIYPSLIFANKDELVLSTGASKIDKLKNNRLGSKKDSALYYNWAFFTLNPTKDEQEWLRSYKEIEIGDDSEDEDEDSKIYTTSSNKKNKYKERAEDEKSKIEKVVLLNPNVIRVKANNKGGKVNQLSDEDLSNSILTSMLNMSKDFSNDFQSLDPMSKTSDIDEYNKFAFVKHWTSSYQRLEGEVIPFDALDSNNQKYMTPGTVFVNTDVISFRESRELNYLHILVVLYFPLIVPYYVYYYIKKEHSTVVVLNAYDIASNSLVSSNVSYYEAKSSEDYLKSHLYTMFFSFLKHKK